MITWLLEIPPDAVYPTQTLLGLTEANQVVATSPYTNGDICGIALLTYELPNSFFTTLFLIGYSALQTPRSKDLDTVTKDLNTLIDSNPDYPFLVMDQERVIAHATNDWRPIT